MSRKRAHTGTSFVWRHIVLFSSDAKLKRTAYTEPTLDVIMRCIREDLDSDRQSGSNKAGTVAVPGSASKHPATFDAVMSAIKSLPAAILQSPMKILFTSDSIRGANLRWAQKLEMCPRIALFDSYVSQWRSRWSRASERRPDQCAQCIGTEELIGLM